MSKSVLVVDTPRNCYVELNTVAILDTRDAAN